VPFILIPVILISIMKYVSVKIQRKGLYLLIMRGNSTFEGMELYFGKVLNLLLMRVIVKENME
jgi:hypothetical protein